MSVIDPTKPKPPPTPIAPPPPPKEKTEKKGLKLDFEVSGPKPDYSNLALKGQGVQSTVFGPVTPNISKMSDAELAGAITKMGAAMKKNVGKVNDDDFRTYGSLIKEAAFREARLLDSKKPIADMTNEELFHHALAFDMAKASGMKLTPEQETRSTTIDNALYARGKVDFDGEIKHLENLREEVKKEIGVHCPAAAAGAFGLATHVKVPSMLASGAVIYHGVQEKKYGAAMLETALAIGSVIPGVDKYAEGAATAINTIQCADAAYEFHHITKQIEQAKAEKAKHP